MSLEDLPLAGRTILVTRPAERSAGLIDALGALGAHAVARPTIALVPPTDGEPARRALRALGEYDWVVFSSPSGVHFFFELARGWLAGPPPLPRGVAAIGPATARALAMQGCSATVVAQESHAEGLAAALAGHVGRGDRVLLVRPEVARDVLPSVLVDAGAGVDVVPFYRNVAAPGVEAVAADVTAGIYDVAVFTSPSTALRLVEAGAIVKLDIKAALRRMAIVAIGDVTARALQQARIPVSAVALEPSEEGITDALKRLFTP